MKTRISGLAIVVAFLNFSLNAESDRNMAISISPIAPIFGSFDLLFQYKALDFLAITVPGKFKYSWFTKSFVTAAGKDEYKNGTVTKTPFDIATGLGARFLLKNKGLVDTFYIEPRLLFGYEQAGYKFGNITLEAEAMRVQPMVQFGWDWYWDYGLYMSLGAGLGYYFYFNRKADIPDNMKNNYFLSWIIPTSSSSFALDGEFKIGYSW